LIRGVRPISPIITTRVLSSIPRRSKSVTSALKARSACGISSFSRPAPRRRRYPHRQNAFKKHVDFANEESVDAFLHRTDLEPINRRLQHHVQRVHRHIQRDAA
jgi:hypothetical protein